MYRDFEFEMMQIIRIETPRDMPYISSDVATHIVTKLKANDPELLDGFLKGRAEYVIHQIINRRDGSTRSHARQMAKRNKFTDAVKEFEKGNRVPLTDFLSIVHVVQNGARKNIGKMNREELVFVAEDYFTRAEYNQLHATFL